MDLALQSDPATTAAPITFDAAADWTVLDVDVEVHSAQLRFERGANSGTVRVRNGEASLPTVIRASVAEGVTTVDITAVFEHAGRVCGLARRSFPAVSPGSPVGNPQTGTPAPTSPGMQIVVAPASPVLTIKVIKPRGGDRLVWSCTAPKGFGGARTSGDIELADPQRFTEDLLKTCPGLVSGQHRPHLRGVGVAIWRATPPEFQQLYLDLRRKFGSAFPIQIVTDERHVPWEMMWSEQADIVGDHLFMSHRIARWLCDEENNMASSLPAGRIVSFVPLYGAEAVLPATAEEGKWLVSTFGARAMPPTFAAFTGLLEDCCDDRVSILHFAGHGAYQTAAGHGGIQMDDGWITVPAVSHGGVQLGRRDRSLVVLNACESGVVADRLGAVSGWPSALAQCGFGGVLAPLWAVEDGPASCFVRTAIERYMVEGDPFAEAVRRARIAGRDRSATAYAYAYHGDVMAHGEDAI